VTGSVSSSAFTSLCFILKNSSSRKEHHHIQNQFVSMHFPPAAKWQFDIDKYIDPLVPRNRLDRLPNTVSHFLGYRDAPREPIGNIPIALWSFIGAFAGTAALSALFMSKWIADQGAPIIIGSFGAAAILEFNVIESPLSQPRNSIAGHFLSAVIGICVTKLFALSDDFEELRWLAGAIAVGLASAVMTLTKTVHPPAGATALLAAVQPNISGLGWWLLPITLVSTLVTTSIACLLNNLHRQFPVYWWSPTGKISRTTKDNNGDVEGVHGSHGQGLGEKEQSNGSRHMENSLRICIDCLEVSVPEHVYLSAEERGILEILQQRLKEAAHTDLSDASTIGKDRADSDNATL